eukprot:s2741_g10.t1
MLSLLRDWMNARNTGRLEVLQENMSQVYGFLLTQETRSALLDWFLLLEHTTEHREDQSRHWWDLLYLARDVEHWGAPKRSLLPVAGGLAAISLAALAGDAFLGKDHFDLRRLAGGGANTPGEVAKAAKPAGAAAKTLAKDLLKLYLESPL